MRLSDEEFIRAIAFSPAEEYEAIQFFMRCSESPDNKLALDALKDVPEEERVHADEFLRLLQELAPEDRDLSAVGA